MESSQVNKEKLGFDSKKFTTGLVLCFAFLPVLIIFSKLYRNSTFDLDQVFDGNAQNAAALRYGSRSDSSEPAMSPDGQLLHGTMDSRIGEGPDSRNIYFQPTSQPDDKVFNGNYRMENPEVGDESGSTNDSSQPNNVKLLDRLFSPGLDESSCISRYESALYRKSSPHKPSPYLLSKLREYEYLHKRCGPNTKSYNRTLNKLVKVNHKSRSTDCKYIVWIPANGLGNRMLSMAATFLYALLTNRVLLVDHGADMADIFCEPFPDTSWLLPSNFPLKNHHKMRYAKSFGSVINMSVEPWPSHLYLNLDHSEYYLDKKLFYCDKTEALLGRVSWLIMVSDQYFAPYFFLSQSYRKEVSKLFPEKDIVFYHLGRYLFNPTNQAWGLIARFYDAYLAKADQRVGLQIRINNPKSTPFQTALDQLLLCTLKEKVLPQVEAQKSLDHQSKNKTSKAILVTSLYHEFHENLSQMYWTRPTVTGEVVGVYQPSHEEYQHFGDNMHNIKAWAEIYLLSLADVLVTSAWSTFGYVAQALGGLKPWVLYKTDDKNIPNPPCIRDLSMEPCFHFPPTYDCLENLKVNAGAILPYLRHCVDLKGGVKLLPDHDEL